MHPVGLLVENYQGTLPSGEEPMKHSDIVILEDSMGNNPRELFLTRDFLSHFLGGHY